MKKVEKEKMCLAVLSYPLEVQEQLVEFLFINWQPKRLLENLQYIDQNYNTTYYQDIKSKLDAQLPVVMSVNYL